MMPRKSTVALAFFLLHSGSQLTANAQDQRPRPNSAQAQPSEQAVQAAEKEALRLCGASPVALREIIGRLPGPQKLNCPDWSTSCWCSGGAGSSDCDDLASSGKCGSNPIETGTSANGLGLAGICKRAPGQGACPGISGACP